MMYTFEVIIRAGGQNMIVHLQADSHYNAKMLAEATYGADKVVSYRELTPGCA